MTDLDRMQELVERLADLAFEALETPTGERDQQQEVAEELHQVLGKLTGTGLYRPSANDRGQQSPSVTPDAAVEWGVRVAFAGNPPHVNPHPTPEIARAVAADLGRYGMTTELVTRTVRPWTPA